MAQRPRGKNFAWEDQRFSSKDTMPLASKLIRPEDQTEDALEISRTAGLFDEANDRAIQKLHQAQVARRELLNLAEREGEDEFARLRQMSNEQSEICREKHESAVPARVEAERSKYSVDDYGSDSSSLACCVV